MSTGRIRAASGDRDLGTLVELSQLCFGAASWRRSSFESLLAAAAADAGPGTAWVFCLLAEDDAGAACGYAVAQSAADEVEIQALAVLPERRCQGWGGRLLESALRAARERGVQTAFLEVRVSNRTAQDFYVRRHFRACDLRRGYYPDTGEDALVMRRDLR